MKKKNSAETFIRNTRKVKYKPRCDEQEAHQIPMYQLKPAQFTKIKLLEWNPNLLESRKSKVTNEPRYQLNFQSKQIKSNSARNRNVW